jgi:protoporphyrinogen oxidase
MKYVILGAGLSGLSAAYHLNTDDYVIFESESHIGGLCRTKRVEGYKFDYTGHYIHCKDPRVKELLNELLGEKLISHQRRSGINLYGVVTPYPFQLNTYGHDVAVIKECLMGLIEAKYRKESADINSFDDWILSTCGDGIANHFMRPYNAKLWTVHPREMTTDWLSTYVPDPDIESALEGALQCNSDTVGYNASFLYPDDGGIEQLPQSFRCKVKNIELSSKIEAIDLENKVVYYGGRSERYDKLISTIPIHQFVNKIKGINEEVLEVSDERLNYNNLFAINIGAKKMNNGGYHWLYFPESKYNFYRVGFPSTLSKNMAPEGMASASVEVAYSKLDLSFLSRQEEVVEEVIKGLVLADILQKEDIDVVNTMFIPNAYVIYDKYRRESLQSIQKYLLENDVVSVGRYGGWEYSAMEDAIIHGMCAAERVRVV